MPVYNGPFSLAFILAFVDSTRERLCNANMLFSPYYASLPLQKQMLIPDARLNMEATYYYKNFYSSCFAQPRPEAQRLEAMNAKINANTVHWH